MTPDRKHPHVAVIGAGFSGLMTAVHLTTLSVDLRVTLIERRPVFGRGVAYDTRDPGHLLNVRLDNMSAFPDRPDDLADWSPPAIRPPRRTTSSVAACTETIWPRSGTGPSLRQTAD